MLVATGSLRGKQSDADFISCGNRIAETWSRDYHLVIERGRKHRSLPVSLYERIIHCGGNNSE